VNATSISTPHIFLNSNKRSDSRAPLKNKINKQVILASRKNGTFENAENILITFYLAK
jgi:hypothetical protein